MSKFIIYKQLDTMDCGPTCLQMIFKYYGKSHSLQTLRKQCYITRKGISMLEMSDIAETLGMHSLGISTNFHTLKNEVPLPCIAHWKQQHFVVVYKITQKWVYVADPGSGLVQYTHQEFLAGWSNINQQKEEIIQLKEQDKPTLQSKNEIVFEEQLAEDNINNTNEGVLLLLEPTPKFYEI